MPRRLFKRHMLDPESIHSQKLLRFLGKLTHDPDLQHLNRYSISHAITAGLFAAFIPMPMQMLLVASLTMWIRSNLPTSVGLVWLTNPITTPPVFYCTYKLGAWLMQVPPHTLPDHLIWEQASQGLSSLWQPFLLGSVVYGIIATVLGYALTMPYWRWWVQRSWGRRCRQRHKRAAAR